MLFFFCAEVDLEHLYDRATTRLVVFTSVKDSAMQDFVSMGKDPMTSDATIRFLVSKFDTKSSVERHTLKDILEGIGPASIDLITREMDWRGTDEEARSIKQSLWILGEIGTAQIVEPVGRFTKDDAWSVRSAAFTALGKSGSNTAVEHVLDGLKDTIALVRKSAYYALSEIATEQEMPFLLAGLTDPYYGARYAALSGIRRLKQDGLIFFEQLVDDETRNYFFLAAAAGSDIEYLLDDHFWSASPATRKAMYQIMPKTLLEDALEKEAHPLLKKLLEKRIAFLQQK